VEVIILSIDFLIKDRNLVVKIAGEIDHHYSEEIKFKIEKEFSKTNSKNIIFDFSELTFMDSSGIGMIIGRYKAIGKQGGQVIVASINENPKKLIEMAGLHKILKCYNNVNEAIESLK
jgi:stage II sporulation protein AA (anti-sigma F factor antagonist)